MLTFIALVIINTLIVLLSCPLWRSGLIKIPLLQRRSGEMALCVQWRHFHGDREFPVHRPPRVRLCSLLPLTRSPKISNHNTISGNKNRCHGLRVSTDPEWVSTSPGRMHRRCLHVDARAMRRDTEIRSVVYIGWPEWLTFLTVQYWPAFIDNQREVPGWVILTWTSIISTND